MQCNLHSLSRGTLPPWPRISKGSPWTDAEEKKETDCLDTSVWHSSDFLPLKSCWHLSGKTQEAEPAASLPLPRLNNHSKPTHSSEHLLSHKETSHFVCSHTSRGSIPSREYTACFVSFLSQIQCLDFKGSNFKINENKISHSTQMWNTSNTSWNAYQFAIHVKRSP